MSCHIIVYSKVLVQETNKKTKVEDIFGIESEYSLRRVDDDSIGLSSGCLSIE